MNTGPIRIWSPAQSRVRIEYSSHLLREVLRESTNGEGSGVLFGVKHDNEVRVVAALSLAGLEPVGLFFVRARGEVFLTEANLAQFEEFGDGVALVTAGPRGGFFVREDDGSIQSVQSYQEFAVEHAARPKSRRLLSNIPHGLPWAWAALACVALAIPLMARPFLIPLLPRAPLDLVVREHSGQLQIRWNLRAASQNAKLEIIDGVEHTTVVLSAGLSNATYVPRTGDVEIVLTNPGTMQRETARYVGYTMKSDPSPHAYRSPALPQVQPRRSRTPGGTVVRTPRHGPSADRRVR